MFGMFENIGKKIKILALVVFWLGVIASVAGGIIIWVDWFNMDGWWAGFGIFLLCAVGGTLVSYMSVILLYAFGEAVDKLTAIERNTARALNVQKTPISQTAQKNVDERVKRLEILRAKGLITEEEYQQKIQRIQGVSI